MRDDDEVAKGSTEKSYEGDADDRREELDRLLQRNRDLRKQLIASEARCSELATRLAQAQDGGLCRVYTRYVGRTRRGFDDRVKQAFPEWDGIPIYASLGLAGETGEFVELIKKWVRGPENKPGEQTLISELGDILWYVFCIAVELGLDPEAIIKYNMDKLDTRMLFGKDAAK